MKKFLYLIAALIVMPFFLNATTKRADSYFRQVILDGKLTIVGNYPVEDAMAKTVNCYHFVNDDMGKLTKIEYMKASHLSNDMVLGVAQIMFDYSGGFEKRTYLDVYSQPMKDHISGVYSVRLKLDESNHTLTLCNYNKQGVLSRDNYCVTQYMWWLDKDGKRVKSIRLDAKGNRITDSNGFFELRTQTDDNGVVEQTNYNGRGKVFERRNIISMVRRKYDDKGNLTELRYMGSNGQLKEEGRYGIAVIKWKYDGMGNLVEESYYGTDEQLKEPAFGNFSFVTRQYKYDDKGNVVHTSYIQKNQMN